MQNLFDSSTYPEKEPKSFVIGDRVAWQRPDIAAIYDPSLFTLSYTFRLSNSPGTAFTITSVAQDFVVELSAAVTALYSPGEYTWQQSIIRNSDSERITLASCQITAIPNSAASASDQRSHAQIMLSLIERALECKASNDELDALSAKFGDDQIAKDPARLVEMRDRYRIEVNSEKAAALASCDISGETLFCTRKVNVRFVKPA